MTAAARRTAYGVDYDAVAPIYDNSPFRQKQPDPALISFLAERPAGPERVLDVGCGTGNQLVADLAIRELAERGQLVGLDPFAGMLREVFRVLRAGGRLVLTNIAPRQMAVAQLRRCARSGRRRAAHAARRSSVARSGTDQRPGPFTSST